MATLCKTFPTTETALLAADALSTAGVPTSEMVLLIGHPYHDVRTESVGGFGGPIDPDAPFGKYAGPPRQRWPAAGGFIAHPDEQRQGSFGDVDCILSVTRHDGDRRVEAIDDHSARRLLTEAQVPDEVARRMVRHLHGGDAVMFVQLTHVDLGTAEALIDHSPVATRACAGARPDAPLGPPPGPSDGCRPNTM
jgi:hypothetical protein